MNYLKNILKKIYDILAKSSNYIYEKSKMITKISILKIYLKIPNYMRGLVLFIIIIGIATIYNNYFRPKPKYFEDTEFGKQQMQIMLQNMDKIRVIEQEPNNDLKQKTEVDIENKTVNGELKENLKSSFSRKNGRDSLTNFEDDYYFGSIEAPISIIEYSSYSCSHCISFHNNIMSKLKNEYIDTKKVKYIKRIIVKPNSLIAVMLPYCAKKENRYSLVSDLYSNVNKWLKNPTKQKNELKEISIRNGFSVAQFESCVNKKDLAQRIIEKQNRELSDLSIYSTPTIFINGTKVNGGASYDIIKQKIENLLTEKNSNKK